MNTPDSAVHRPPTDKSWGKAILWSLPMWAISNLMLLGGGLPRDILHLVPLVFTILFANILFLLMMRTGKTDRYRAVFFILMAVCFIVSFLSHYMESRGSISLSDAELIKGRTPFCHMVIPQTALVTAFTQTIIFPGSMLGTYASIASMLVLWIGASLALGRGFCSWTCFFGGLEDGFSRILRKAKIRNIDRKWTYLPYAVLLVVIVASTAALSPFYCEWLCPFKTVTEYPEVNSFRTIVQAVIFVSLFFGLVVILPVLSKKRTQCGLFCPMGAFQSFTNKVNPFHMQIDREKCRNCGKCVRVCPTFSLNQDSFTSGQTRISCIKCGKCADECPEGAISYHVKGTRPSFGSQAGRMFFLYPAFLLLVVFGSGMIQDGLYRLLLFSTTGTFIR